MLLITLNAVCKANGLMVCFNAPGGRRVWLGWVLQAGAWVNRAFYAMQCASVCDLFARAGACVSQATLAQLGERRFIKWVALALVNNFAIPGKAITLHGADDVCTGACYVSGLVYVLNAQPPLPSLAFGIAITGDSGHQ